MNPTPLDELVAGLAVLDWSDRPAAHRAVQARLAGVRDPAALLEHLRHRDPAQTEYDRSSEKTTHFKWFVAADPEQRFSVWLNEYKPSSHRRTGHAEVPHNHRFWFTSLLLAGGFENAVYRPREDATLELERTVELRAGDTFVVDPDEVHALRALREGTLTLLVQSVPVRSYSEVWEDGRVLRYADLPSARERLNERLARVQPFDASARVHH